MVLVYEVYGASSQDENLLSALNFTIIGAFMLPGENVHAKGFASALLVDVRNGYPYGTASKVLKNETVTPSAGSRSVRYAMHRETVTQAAIALVPEVEILMRKLKTSLASLDSTSRTATSKR